MQKPRISKKDIYNQGTARRSVLLEHGREGRLDQGPHHERENKVIVLTQARYSAKRRIRVTTLIPLNDPMWLLLQ